MLLNNADAIGKTKGVCANKGETRINHIMFDDDYVLFGRSQLKNDII